MDIDKDGLREAERRYKDQPKPKPNVYYSWADSTNLIFPDYAAAKDDMSKLRLEEYISTKHSFDVVGMMFALHYMFENETTLKNFLQNVSDNLKVGGHFIGTCFDGERVFNLLKANKGYVEEKDADDNDITPWTCPLCRKEGERINKYGICREPNCMGVRTSQTERDRTEHKKRKVEMWLSEYCESEHSKIMNFSKSFRAWSMTGSDGAEAIVECETTQSETLLLHYKLQTGNGTKLRKVKNCGHEKVPTSYDGLCFNF